MSLLSYAMAPGTDLPYLDLQARSDSIHRFSVLFLPMCLVAIALLWPIGRVFADFRFIHLPIRVLLSVLWLSASMWTGYLLRFDQCIEQKGLAGQFIPPRPAVSLATAKGSGRGPYHEEGGPGIATPNLPNGDHLTLDRRTLALRNATGGYRWNRLRDYGWPAAMMLTAETVLLTGPGLKFEDDVVLSVVELQSGRRWYEYHTLGNGITPVSIDGDFLAFATNRPARSSVVLLDWVHARSVWASPLSVWVNLTPRLTPRHVEVAAGGQLYRLSRADGSLVSSHRACAKPLAWQVVCQDDQIIAWRPTPAP